MLLIIVEFLLEMDLTCIGVLRVNRKLRLLASLFYPRIHINPSIANMFNDLSEVSIANIQAKAGKSSGLMIEIKNLFSSNSRWYFGWVQLRPSNSGRDWYDIVDFYWKPKKK
jgi:hypothetical protein